MEIKNIFSFLNKDENMACPKCSKQNKHSVLFDNAMICPECGAYFRMGALERIALITDKDSFLECDGELKSQNPIDFPDYDTKIKKAVKDSGLNEGVVCGTATIDGNPCAIFVMDSKFMMGSMGCVVGEKITRLFEKATQEHLPVVGFTTSGGARMQEGIFSLMQMAKVSGAAKKHSDSGNLYITVITDPTTGGVTASFAMQGDIIISEPKALIGFAGARVIEQTTGKKLPDGFQKAEFMLEHGFIDMIEDRKRLKYTVGKLLKIHAASAYREWK